jgi:NAD(P)-dependent dehydrogenase (short-subunit alcohol dehydrogenase family)
MPPREQTPPAGHAAAGAAPGRGRLEGRRVLVVGAGQADVDEQRGTFDLPGNGRAISLLAAREGASVACADLELDRARTTTALIEGEGGRAVSLAGDAADETGMQRIVEAATDMLGSLDGLVLNVGAALGSTLESTKLSELEAAWRINVGSQFLGLRHGLPAMSRGGAVVMISAIAALRIGPTPLPYDVTKAALVPLRHHGARSGEPRGVRVNMVLPGAIATPMAQRLFGGPHDLRWGREGTAWETAYAVVHLLSDEASYINATTLVVDGGLTAIH